MGQNGDDSLCGGDGNDLVVGDWADTDPSPAQTAVPTITPIFTIVKETVPVFPRELVEIQPCFSLPAFFALRSVEEESATATVLQQYGTAASKQIVKADGTTTLLFTCNGEQAAIEGAQTTTPFSASLKDLLSKWAARCCPSIRDVSVVVAKTLQDSRATTLQEVEAVQEAEAEPEPELPQCQMAFERSATGEVEPGQTLSVAALLDVPPGRLASVANLVQVPEDLLLAAAIEASNADADTASANATIAYSGDLVMLVEALADAEYASLTATAAGDFARINCRGFDGLAYMPFKEDDDADQETWLSCCCIAPLAVRSLLASVKAGLAAAPQDYFTFMPTTSPTTSPTLAPTLAPTTSPTLMPTASPTANATMGGGSNTTSSSGNSTSSGSGGNNNATAPSLSAANFTVPPVQWLSLAQLGAPALATLVPSGESSNCFDSQLSGLFYPQLTAEAGECLAALRSLVVVDGLPSAPSLVPARMYRFCDSDCRQEQSLVRASTGSNGTLPADAAVLANFTDTSSNATVGGNGFGVLSDKAVISALVFTQDSLQQAHFSCTKVGKGGSFSDTGGGDTLANSDFKLRFQLQLTPPPLFFFQALYGPVLEYLC